MFAARFSNGWPLAVAGAHKVSRQTPPGQGLIAWTLASRNLEIRRDRLMWPLRTRCRIAPGSHGPDLGERCGIRAIHGPFIPSGVAEFTRQILRALLLTLAQCASALELAEQEWIVAGKLAAVDLKHVNATKQQACVEATPRRRRRFNAVDGLRGAFDRPRVAVFRPWPGHNYPHSSAPFQSCGKNGYCALLRRRSRPSRDVIFAHRSRRALI